MALLGGRAYTEVIKLTEAIGWGCGPNPIGLCPSEKEVGTQGQMCTEGGDVETRREKTAICQPRAPEDSQRH